MNRKEREEVFKAINNVANRVNDVSQKLDGVMHRNLMELCRCLTIPQTRKSL